MRRSHTAPEKRKALRSFKQRRYVVLAKAYISCLIDVPKQSAAQYAKGEWCIYVLRGNVEADLSDVDTTAGLYTDNCFVIILGRLIESEPGREHGRQQ